jgi:hypothetical protein
MKAKTQFIIGIILFVIVIAIGCYGYTHPLSFNPQFRIAQYVLAVISGGMLGSAVFKLNN